MSRIECKWEKSFVLPHLHSIRLMLSAASELGLKLPNITTTTATRTPPNKVLIRKTIAIHVRYKYLYISFPSSTKQQPEVTKFFVVRRTVIFRISFGTKRRHRIFILSMFLEPLAYWADLSLATNVNSFLTAARRGGGVYSTIHVQNLPYSLNDLTNTSKSCFRTAL